MPDSPESVSVPLAIRDALAGGATVLAPNRRAAADLSARYDQAQAASGRRAWEPAAIRSWNTWLGNLWSTLIASGADSRLLLNPAQEHTLWREIIAADSTPASLGSLDSLADLAQSAFRLAASYEVLSGLRRFALTHDSRTFAGWAAAFTRRCEQRQYLSLAELPSALTHHLESNTLTPPLSLLLAGFDDDTPARTSLLAALTTRGCTLTRLTIESEPDKESANESGCPILATASSSPGGVSSEARPHSERIIIRAATPQDELLTAAHWVRNFIETRLSSPLEPSSLLAQQDPSPLLPSTLPPQQIPRIALIVPTLSDDRHALESTLRQILAPELQSITADLSSAPFAFATGTPLAGTAMIAAALDLIRWSTAPLPLERVTALLLSPYLGTTAGLPERAAFDAFTLRRTPMLRPEIDIPRTLRLAHTHPAVAALLIPLATRAPRAADRRSHADWMEFIRDLLRDAAFPGDRPLTAHEFHDARSWDHALDTVATLDFAGARVDFPTALAALEREARAATAAHGDPTAAVQVMTPTETAGSSFDAIVFLRATDANWPTPEHPNPLLGWPLQHDRKMPGTDPAQTFTRAEQATAHLLASAPNVLFFYAAEDETGPQRLSPIFEQLVWPQINASELTTPAPATHIVLEEIEDTTPLPPLPSDLVFGGARVLKQQAACGFLAFSELRLRSQPVDTLSPGLDALESGNFLHRAMQAFWAETGSQDSLRNMDPASREALLTRSIAAAVDRRLAPETPWDAAYLQLQKDRLLSLLRSWLDAELDRGPFSVVALEADTVVTVGPLSLRVRMDRIDRVETGTDAGFVYIDYKTGYSANPRDWGGPRPEEPQLPLYALLSQPGELKAIAFAKVRAGKGMAWLGFQADPGILPMKRPSTVDLDILIDEWRYTLTTLAEDFAAGRATVDPKDFAINCARCAQRLLCRVNPELLFLNAEDATDDEAGDAE